MVYDIYDVTSYDKPFHVIYHCLWCAIIGQMKLNRIAVASKIQIWNKQSLTDNCTESTAITLLCAIVVFGFLNFAAKSINDFRYYLLKVCEKRVLKISFWWKFCEKFVDLVQGECNLFTIITIPEFFEKNWFGFIEWKVKFEENFFLSIQTKDLRSRTSRDHVACPITSLQRELKSSTSIFSSKFRNNFSNLISTIKINILLHKLQLNSLAKQCEIASTEYHSVKIGGLLQTTHSTKEAQ